MISLLGTLLLFGQMGASLRVWLQALRFFNYDFNYNSLLNYL